MSLVRKSLIAFAAEGALLGLSIVTGSITARLLEPEGFGRLAVVASSAGFLMAIFQLALADSLAHAWSHKRFSGGAFVGTILVLGSALGAAAVATGEAFLWLAHDRLFAGIDPWTARAGVLFVPVMLLNALLATILQLRNDVEMISYARVAGKAVVVALMAGLLATLFWGEGATGNGRHVLVATLIWFANAGLSATLLCQLTRLWQTVPEPWRINDALARLLLRKSFIAYPGYLALFALMRLDFFLTKTLLPPGEAETQLGLYSLACALAETITWVGYAISVSISARVVSDDLKDAARLSAQAMRWNALLSALAAGAVMIAAPWLVWLYGGAQYAGAVAPLILLAPGLGSYYLYIQYHALMARLGWFGASNALLIGGAVFNGSLNLWLIPAYGVAGAAFATTAAFWGLLAVAATLMHRWGALTFDMLFSRGLGKDGIVRSEA
jgi:O-antigen/teichoic acid export membrane protein